MQILAFVSVLTLAVGCTQAPVRTRARSSDGSGARLGGSGTETLKGVLTEIPAQIAAGGSFSATLVLHNPTGSAIELSSDGCQPEVRIGLRSENVDAVPQPTSRCAFGALAVPPGESSYSVLVKAQYTTCGSPAQGLVPCGDQTMPPLPPGDYEVVLEGLPLAVPSEPIRVVG